MFRATARSATRAVATMTQQRGYKVPIKDMRFLMDSVHGMNAHYDSIQAKKNAEAIDVDLVRAVMDEAAKFSENVILPLDESSDRIGCTRHDEHNVTTPPGYKDAYDQYREGGWQAMSSPEELGGQALPQSVSLMTSEMMASANWSWAMFPGLSKGAINTLQRYGDEHLKSKFLERMIAGEWTGTMCLTEPQAGSDLNLVTTKAEPNGDGSYSITGTKIFISCGEHDLTDNIVHCVLARLPGAPEGTAGISLFAVPKRKVADDGTVGDLNGAKIGRIEDKMGCHGSPTCEINFENAHGYLIGTENKGMRQMFTFINTSRLGTAMQGVCAAEKSFQASLPYAKDRLAFRSLSGTKSPDTVADPIIVHPDVRRMLMTQKVIAEGGRSMMMECSKLADLMYEAQVAGDEKLADHYDDKMGFLTPILKGFLTEVGTECASLGIQIYGGHGYIKSNRVEQILRDVRIACVWEGTTGIQALDLLGRKVLYKKLTPVNQVCLDIYKEFVPKILGGSYPNAGLHARTLLKLTTSWQSASAQIAVRATKDRDSVGSASVDYLMYSGYLLMGKHWYKMADAASQALKTATTDDEKIFLEAKIKSANFYFDSILPKAKAHRETMMAPTTSTMSMTTEQFSM